MEGSTWDDERGRGQPYLKTSEGKAQRHVPVMPKHRIKYAYRRTLSKHPVKGGLGRTHQRPQSPTVKEVAINSRGSVTPTSRLQEPRPSERLEYQRHPDLAQNLAGHGMGLWQGRDNNAICPVVTTLKTCRLKGLYMHRGNIVRTCLRCQTARGGVRNTVDEAKSRALLAMS